MNEINNIKHRLKEYLTVECIFYDKNRNTWKCPCHDDQTPSAVYYETGKNSSTPVLWCPVTNNSMSIFDVAGKIHNTTDFKEMLKIVKDKLNITEKIAVNEIRTPEKKQKTSNPQPFPTDRTEKDKINNKILEISEKNIEKWGKRTNQSWKYFNEDGKIISIDIRYEKEGERKTVQTFWYDGQLKWYKTPIFIYNAHKIKEDKPIIIHEGAKCADIGTENLPEFNHINWSGGCSKADKVDWSILKNKKVYILPDDDHKKYPENHKLSGQELPEKEQPGMKAALKIKKQLPNAIIIPFIEKVREIKPDGADIEQILQIMSPEEFTKYINDLNIPEKKEITKFEDDLPIINDFDYKYERVEIALQQFFEFRKNVITGQVEWCRKDEGIWKNITDYDKNTIRTWLMKNFIKSIPMTDLNSILNSKFAKEYDQVKEYFDNLDKWDGHDYINDLCNLIILKKGQFGENIDEKDVLYDYMRRWLCGNVSGMLQKYENQTCFCLFGPQGIGKTTFFRNMGIAENLTFVGVYNPSDKDSKINLSEKTLIVLDEFESTTKYEMGSLKAALTMRHMTIRRPYASSSEILPRRASFCATANKTEILSDLTGSRRWLCIEAERVNFDGVTYELMKNVYSQCKKMLEDGFRYYQYNEIFNLESNNDKFNVVHPEEEAILLKYENVTDLFDNGIDIEYLTNTQILSEISEEHNGIRFNQRVLGMILKKHGFTQVYRDRMRKYRIRRKIE